MELSNPFISNNGLRITSRTYQSMKLAWPSVENGTESESSDDVDSANKVEPKLGETFVESTATVLPWNSDGNWIEVEIKAEASSVWVSIYRGYGTNCEVNALTPNSVFMFRMKRRQESEWGTEIVGSTEPLPASVEDLNRAVEMNSESLTTRILELSKPSQIKQILKARDRNGMTALMVACQMGNVTIAEKLILAGSDVNAFSINSFRTPLIFASIMGRENIVILLDKHKVNWSHQDKGGCTALDYAINGGHLNLVKLAHARLGTTILTQAKTVDWSLLMRAAILSDNPEVLNFLMKNGEDVNQGQDVNSKSVLMSAILAKKPRIVQFLLDKGANAFHESEDGNNCLAVARGLEYREITEMIQKKTESLVHNEEPETE